MRTIILLLLLIGASNALAATNWNVPSPPKDASDQNSLYDYLNQLYNHFEQLHVTTTNPDSNRLGKFGDTILYQATGSVYYFAVETDSPGGIAWKGIRLQPM